MADDAANLSPKFPSTHWTQLETAGQDHAQGRPDLSRLLEKYLPAMKAHLVLRRRTDPDDADDLLQAFITSKILEQNLIAKADRSRGSRFRSFLVTALDNFVSNQLRNETRRQQPGAYRLEDIEACTDCPLPADQTDEFNSAWARQVILHTLQKMESECLAKGRPDIWEVFSGRIVGPTLNGQPLVPYAELVQKFGYQAPVQASMVLVTGKRMFQRLLRQVVGEYAQESTEVEEEVAQLLKSLSDRIAKPGHDSQHR